jgi:hypothetical protein
LADGDDDVAGGESEAGQVGAFDHATPPVGGDGGGDRCDGGLNGFMAGRDVLDVTTPGFEEERGLPARAVPLE